MLELIVSFMLNLGFSPHTITVHAPNRAPVTYELRLDRGAQKQVAGYKIRVVQITPSVTTPPAKPVTQKKPAPQPKPVVTAPTPKPPMTTAPQPPAPKEPAVAPEPVPTPKPTPTQPTVPEDSSPSITGIFTFTNQARTEHNLSALARDPMLDRIALERARDMFEGQYFAHNSPTGESFVTLANEYGYAYRMIGENIARGTFDTSEAIVDGWMNSPGHRANILKDTYSHIGIAAIEGNFNGRKQWMAVQVFSLPR